MRILVDCRWLGMGGIGRATELLLRGLAEVRPVATCIVWGPPAARGLAWDGAVYEQSRRSPRRLWGQAELLRVPAHDVAIYLGPIRPFSRQRSLTVIHDTIPLRYGGTAWERRVRRGYYRAVTRLSSRVLTPSQFSRACLQHDLGLGPDRVDVLRYPIDPALVARVDALRRRRPRSDVVLYVGRFARHKNLPHLVRAFAQTRFSASGGTLLLVGGTATEMRRLREHIPASALDRVQMEGVVSQARLDELYATARLLVMPSLEEGFGLPAWEAMSCGLPVCVSDGGALPEITDGTAKPFAAASAAELAAAIDRDVASTEPPARPAGGSLGDFARQFLATLSAIAGVPIR